MGSFSSPGLATGITVAATTQNTLNFGLMEVTIPARKVKKIETTTMASTDVTYLFGKVLDNGVLKLKCFNKVDLYPFTFLGTSDTWTMTFPLSGAGTVHATVVFQGAMTDYVPSSTAVDGAFEADVEITITGGITITPQS
jgi:hypothetical protein